MQRYDPTTVGDGLFWGLIAVGVIVTLLWICSPFEEKRKD